MSSETCRVQGVTTPYLLPLRLLLKNFSQASSMSSCIQIVQMTSRPILSVLNAPTRSFKCLSLRNPLLPKNLPSIPMFGSRFLARSQASGSQRRDVHSAVTFDASKSHFPTHSDLHRDGQPSNELIRDVLVWEHDLQLDDRKFSLWWT